MKAQICELQNFIFKVTIWYQNPKFLSWSDVIYIKYAIIKGAGSLMTCLVLAGKK